MLLLTDAGLTAVIDAAEAAMQEGYLASLALCP